VSDLVTSRDSGIGRCGAEEMRLRMDPLPRGGHRFRQAPSTDPGSLDFDFSCRGRLPIDDDAEFLQKNGLVGVNGIAARSKEPNDSTKLPAARGSRVARPKSARGE
jgi:hypothetical protein